MTEENKIYNQKKQVGSKSFILIILCILSLATWGYLEYLLSFIGPINIGNNPTTSSILGFSKIGAFVFCTIFMLSRRPVFSATATFSLLGLIITGSFIKIYYLGVPLTAADLYFFFGNIKDNSILFFNYPLLGFLVIFSIIFIISTSYWLIVHEKKRNLNKKIQIIFLVCIPIFFLSPANGHDQLFGTKKKYFNSNEDQVHKEISKAYIRNLAMKDSQYSMFNIVEIFFARRSIDFDIPTNVENTLFTPTDYSNNYEKTRYRPDVISILNESLFNPKTLSLCNTTELCDFEIFNNNKNKYPGIYGPLFVHTHGGGTWLSEFAFLSGYDWRIFGEGGAYAPRSVTPNLQSSLASHFKQLGYRTIAVYPVAGNFLNARDAYKHYGFDEFYATEDLGITTEWQSTLDSTIFKKSISLINKTKDKRPVFLFILTIKNHGPHAEEINSIKNINPAFLKKASGLPTPLIDYLNRLNETNEAITSFRNDWLDSKDPRIFLWFGDHQPMFSKTLKTSETFLNESSISSSSHPNPLFLTWYEITSNSSNRKKSKQPVPTDLAFLGTKLLQYSGLPLQRHGEATLQLSERCPFGIANCNDEKLIDEYLSFRIWNLKEIRFPH